MVLMNFERSTVRFICGIVSSPFSLEIWSDVLNHLISLLWLCHYLATLGIAVEFDIHPLLALFLCIDNMSWLLQALLVFLITFYLQIAICCTLAPPTCTNHFITLVWYCIGKSERFSRTNQWWPKSSEVVWNGADENIVGRPLASFSLIWKIGGRLLRSSNINLIKFFWSVDTLILSSNLHVSVSLHVFVWCADTLGSAVYGLFANGSLTNSCVWSTINVLESAVLMGVSLVMTTPHHSFFLLAFACTQQMAGHLSVSLYHINFDASPWEFPHHNGFHLEIGLGISSYFAISMLNYTHQLVLYLNHLVWLSHLVNLLLNGDSKKLFASAWDWDSHLLGSHCWQITSDSLLDYFSSPVDWVFGSSY